ncbi:amidase (plasmid) [Rhizobium sp. 007]|nr:amidase [Rhizobium sp. 007]
MLSARQLAKDIESRILSPDVSVRCSIAAINQQEEMVHAFRFRRSEDSLMEAAKAPGPLAGIPFAAKDVFDTIDCPTAYGTAIYDGHQPARDAAVVALARMRGAVLMGKSVATEFSLFGPGPTRNPWNPAHTPGGSSSGSAAAVAAGMVAFSFGTQTAGSTIRPAAFCGIAGFKPSFGLIPVTGVKPLAHSLDTVGVFAAKIPDVVFVLSALSGHESATDDSSSSFRIGVCTGWKGASAGNDALESLEWAICLAEQAGAHIVRLKLPATLEIAHDAHRVIMAFEAVRALSLEHKEHRPRLSHRIRSFLDRGEMVSIECYQRAQKQASDARRAVADIFRDVDAILTPSAPGPAPLGLEHTGSSEFNQLWSLLHLPVANVPGYPSSNGLPLGLQVIGPILMDQRTLSIAAFLESALDRK